MQIGLGISLENTKKQFNSMIDRVVYLFRAALNASGADSTPLSALTGTAPTQVATSSVVAPFYLTSAAAGTTLQTIPAGYSVVPNSRITWDTALGATVSSTEKVTNGTFTDASGWSNTDTGVWSISGGVATANGTGATTQNIRQEIILVIGQKYRVTFTITGYVSGSPRWSYQNINNGTPRTANGTYTEDFTLTSLSTATFYIQAFGFNGNIDNISIKMIEPAYLPMDSEGTPLATPTTLSSGLVKYTGGPAANPVLGCLCEGADTAYGLYSQDLSNAAWVKTNCTGAKDATGMDAVASSASTLTATDVDATCLQSVTLTSGARGFFPYIKRKTGTGAVYVTIDNGGTWTEITADITGWYRCASTKTAANPIFGFKLATSGDAIYVDHANLYGAAVATSPVVTGSGTVTRESRYLTCLGSETGSKLRFDVTPLELGREQWLIGGTATAGVFIDATNKINATDGTTTITSTTSVAAGATYVVGVDFDAGVLSIDGTAEDTDAAMTVPSWAATVFIGAKIGATNVLNGFVTVPISSSDAGFDAGSTN